MEGKNSIEIVVRNGPVGTGTEISRISYSELSQANLVAIQTVCSDAMNKLGAEYAAKSGKK